eukprot:scaffold61118_cov37-Cyclotella_meneghiniana.AAC.1
MQFHIWVYFELNPLTVRTLTSKPIAAGLSQCLIVDMMNDVMRSGLECFLSKGLHGLDFEFLKGEKFSCGPYRRKPSQ